MSSSPHRKSYRNSYQSNSSNINQLHHDIFEHDQKQQQQNHPDYNSYRNSMEPGNSSQQDINLVAPKIAKKDNVLHNAGAEEGSVHTFSEEEKVAYSKFITERLSDVKELAEKYIPIDTTSDQLFTACSDGVLLNKLMESLFPTQVDLKGLVIKNKINPFEVIQNQNIVIKNATKVGCIIVNIGAQDLVNATPYLVLGVIWQIIKSGLLSMVNQNAGEILEILFSDNEDQEEDQQEEHDQHDDKKDKDEHSAEEILMRWVNYHLERAGYDRKISNFSEDIQDSMVYAHLFHQLVPIEFHYLVSKVQEEPNLFARAEYITLACDKIGVKCFLAPSDIALGHPKLNLALVASLFNSEAAIENLRREREEKHRAELERVEREKERIQREREEMERAERERIERERIEREREEQDRLERERMERERMEREKEEQERLERERVERERVEREEYERVECERIERERIERERIEHERIEHERIERIRIEREKEEYERVEKERVERERVESLEREERLLRERMEKEAAERDRLAKEKLEFSKEYNICIRMQKRMVDDPSVTEDLVKLVGDITELKRNLVGEYRNTRALQKDLGKITRHIDRVLESKEEGKKFKKQASKKKIKPVKGVPSGLDPQKMKNYQSLFYYLQTKPHVMGKLLFLLKPNQVDKTFDNLLLSMFPYEISPREEDLFLRALSVAMEYQIKDSQNFTQLLTQESLPMNLLFEYFKKKGLKYLREVITPIILRILDHKDLNLNFDPFWIQKELDRELEIKDGKKSDKSSSNLTFEQLLQNPEIRNLYDTRSGQVIEYANELFVKILKSLDDIPVQLRYLCRVISEKSLDVFAASSPNERVEYVSFFLIIYRFINTIVATPDLLNELVLLQHPYISKQSRFNLAQVSRLVQSAFTKKPWTLSFPTASINNWIKEKSPQAEKFLMKVADVPDLDDLIHYTEYNEIMEENNIRFCTVINLSEIIWLHESILDFYYDLEDIGGLQEVNEEIVKKLVKSSSMTISEKRRYQTNLQRTKQQNTNAMWWLPSCLDALDSPIQMPEQGDRSIQLTFVNRQDTHDRSPRDSFKEAKIWMIEILSKVPHPKKDLNTIAILKDAKTFLRSGNSDSETIQLIGKADKLIEALKNFDQDLVTSKPDVYDVFLYEVEKELVSILRKNALMKSELTRLYSLLKQLRIDTSPIQNLVLFQAEQLEKAVAKKELKKSTQFHKHSLDKSEKFLLSELVKKGMIVRTDLPEATHNKTKVYIKNSSPGIYDIEAKFGPVSKQVTMELDQLLDYSKNHIDTYQLEGITLDVNMTLHVLMKTFGL
ncbi:hypothetical protein CYY_006313 [Polysphondylium violaceum]|uniref:Actin binding protein n=1 Tax=Polysphondylium violaceum TaxID=133409 RepID=A0A8J4PS30_9MYCE|nr:hypothetical protein CYY_006313 [Polysphondylium violaceum]